MSTQTVQKGFLGTPKGFPIVFITEFFERFSYYGMKAILLYYIIAKTTEANPGLGLDNGAGVAIVSLYGAMIYMSNILGGWLSDRIWGPAKAVTIGGFFIMFGHIVLAIPAGLPALFASLALLILGTGMLKSNVSTLVGRLYDEPGMGEGRDAGFSIFYMGINIGGFLAPLVIGTVGQTYGYHVGFSLAAIGMGIGLFLFCVFFGRRYKHLQKEVPNPIAADEKGKVIALAVAIIAVAAIVNGGLFLSGNLNIDVFKYEVMIVAVGLTVFYFTRMLKSKNVTAVERKKVVAYIPLFIAGVLLWMLQEGGGTVIAELATHAKKTLGPVTIQESWYQSVNPFVVIIGAALLAVLWTKLGKNQPTLISKISVGLLLIGASYLIILPAIGPDGFSPFWLIGSLAIVSLGEVLVSPVMLSATTTLAPRAFVAQVMGLWMLANSVGQAINACLANWYIANPFTYFLIIGLLPIIFAVVLFAFRKQILGFINND
ncbi:MAG: oligopeptide:H+ symporter [Lactobacillales bacterium]|jgi:POT family proton-dependent oligopeptide transporter|nr:oligopeptide:H+ symporter [Lactobacillales bacterium]